MITTHLIRNTNANPIFLRYERLCVKHIARPVLRAVSKGLDIDIDKYLIFDKHQDNADVRQIVSYLLAKHTGLTNRQIAMIVSGDGRQYDHSTITHNILTIENQISFIGINGNARPVSKKTFEAVNDIEEILGQLMPC